MFDKDKNKQNKIDKSTAENDFNQFCIDWDIDIDEEMDEDEKKDFNRLKRQIIRKIMSGHLIYNTEKECFNYNLVKQIDGVQTTSLTINRPDGASSLNIDTYKESKSMHKLFSLMASMVKMPTSFLSKMDQIDLKVLQAIFSIFFGS